MEKYSRTDLRNPARRVEDEPCFCNMSHNGGDLNAATREWPQSFLRLIMSLAFFWSKYNFLSYNLVTTTTISATISAILLSQYDKFFCVYSAFCSVDCQTLPNLVLLGFAEHHINIMSDLLLIILVSIFTKFIIFICIIIDHHHHHHHQRGKFSVEAHY